MRKESMVVSTARDALRMVRVAREFGLENVEHLLAAAARANMRIFSPACALMEKESMGQNVYGRADASPFAGFKSRVSFQNFDLFLYLVTSKGLVPTGVGPAQITYAGPLLPDGTREGGFFRQMLVEGLRPWDPQDNMFFGLRLLQGYATKYGSWRAAGRVYNGSEEYGVDLAAKVGQWKERLGET